MNRSVKNERLHARLADEPATLACERETKTVSDVIDLVEDVGYRFTREFRETGCPHTWRSSKRQPQGTVTKTKKSLPIFGTSTVVIAWGFECNGGSEEMVKDSMGIVVEQEFPQLGQRCKVFVFTVVDVHSRE
jgi:hypothetical protein